MLHIVVKYPSTSVAKAESRQRQMQHASNIRRHRGYNWEDTIVKRFNAVDGWSGYRLGSASVSLPDVLALNPATKSAFVIEAKSGTTDRLVVPPAQIERCIDWHHILGPFKQRRVVLAFKFLSKKRIGRAEYGGRKLHEFFKVWDVDTMPIECVCMYDGTTYGRHEDKRVTLKLGDCALPIRKKDAKKRRQDI